MLETGLANAFFVMLLLSAVPLVLGALCGLVVSLVQAATQIQEQSISYLVKFGVLCVLGVLLGARAGQELIAMMRDSISSLVLLGGL